MMQGSQKVLTDLRKVQGTSTAFLLVLKRLKEDIETHFSQSLWLSDSLNQTNPEIYVYILVTLYI